MKVNLLIYLSLCLFIFSCTKDEVIFEPIEHELSSKKSQGDLISRELKQLYGSLRKLDRDLSGESEEFNQGMTNLEEQLDEIPQQLESAAGGLEDLIDKLEEITQAED